MRGDGWDRQRGRQRNSPPPSSISGSTRMRPEQSSRPGLPIEMVAWELCRGEAGFDRAEQQALKDLDTPLGHFFVDCNATAIEAARRQSGSDRMELPDPVAMAVALDRRAVATSTTRHYVQVEAESRLTRGMSVVDSLDVTGRRANVEVVRAIDIPRFKQMVFEAAAASPAPVSP